MEFYLCFIIVLISRTEALSSYWTRVLPRICSNNTPKEINNALLECDRLMDNEVKNIFDECVKDVNGFDVNEDKPKICYYAKKARQLDNCKSDKYKERNYNLTQIIGKEQKHTWCLMKIARPLGWEHLCLGNLSQQKKFAIRRCDDIFRDVANPINQCYEELFSQTNDGRPAACLSFEHSNELWQCLERYTNLRNDTNRSRELEQKANRYMECLKNVD